jgi:hypothetical protein
MPTVDRVSFFGATANPSASMSTRRLITVLS